jgi:hypothetical protein
VTPVPLQKRTVVVMTTPVGLAAVVAVVAVAVVESLACLPFTDG